MINEKRLRQWTKRLRITTTSQAQRKLVVVNRENGKIEGMCCLGIGEVECAGAPLHVSPIGNVPLVGDRDDPSLPYYFRAWLGLSGSGDLQIDWPVGLELRDGTPFNMMTCANLNDLMGFTFEQIADVVDYFGVREA